MANDNMDRDTMRGRGEDRMRNQNRESGDWSPNEPDRSQSQEPGSRSQIRDKGSRSQDREPAEGSRDTSAGGITNRPMSEERDNQARVPPRGENKEGGHA
jgi:hypothetical protein